MGRGPKKQRGGGGGKAGGEDGSNKRNAKRFSKAAMEIQADADGLDSDSEDHEDAFQQKRDKVNLNVSDDDQDDGLEDEEGIMVRNLPGTLCTRALQFHFVYCRAVAYMQGYTWTSSAYFSSGACKQAGAAYAHKHYCAMQSRRPARAVQHVGCTPSAGA